jgi:hypothetical protein
MLATMPRYVEKSFLLRREFELGADHVRYSGSQRFGAIVEQRVPLSQLQPDPARMFLRDKSVESAVAWLVFIGIIVVAAVPFFRGLDRVDPERWAHFLWGLFFVVIVGVVLFAALAKRIEHAVFYSHAGVPVLSIGRRGKDAGEFESFIASVAQAAAQQR